MGLVMLQTNVVPSTLAPMMLSDGYPQGETPEGGASDLIKMAVGLWRRRHVAILTALGLSVAASLAYLLVMPPTYTGVAKVLFENSKSEFLQRQSLLPDNPVDRNQLANQLEELRSKSVAIAVINKLDLANDADFQPRGALHRISNLLRPLFERLGHNVSNPSESKGEPSDDVISTFDSRLTAAQVGVSNVIEIGFKASSPERAAEIANAVAEAFITDQLNNKLAANRAATAWLESRLHELGKQATNAEQDANLFKLKHNIVSAGGSLVGDQRLTDLNARLVAAQSVTSDAQVRLKRFETILPQQSGASRLSLPVVDPSNADVLNSSIINHLREEYLDASRKEADWSVRYGKHHQAVLNLQARMKNIRVAIMDEVRRLSTSAKNDYEMARQRQEEMEKQLAQAIVASRTTGAAELTLRELELRAKNFRGLYESLLTKHTASVQQDSFPISDARIISLASASLAKSKPRSALILALGLFGGLGLGLGVGLLREITEGGFRTLVQVESTLQKRCLSVVPFVKSRRAVDSRFPYTAQNTVGKRTIARGSGIFWEASGTPSSRFAESIRAIKLAIDQGRNVKGGKVIGITSSLPGEGKSTIAAALAQLTAHSGARTIIVDGDLRNPSLSRNLTPSAEAGIAEITLGKKFIEEVAWKDSETKLTFLPAVKGVSVFNSSEIIASDRTKQLFDWLKDNYDYVIVDLPPLVPIIDAQVAAELVDGFVLAVEWGRTNVDVVKHALHTAPNVGDALIGVALTKTNMKKIGRYDNYYDEYYSPKHLAHYGITT